TVSLNGNAGIVSGAATQLSYQVRVNQLAPWLKLAGTVGDGRMSLYGTVAGKLRGIRGVLLSAQGKLAFQSMHFSNVSFAGGDADYKFDGIGQSGWPQGDVSTQLTALEANGMTLRALAVHVRIDRG